GGPPEPRADPDDADRMGPAARRQPVRSSVREAIDSAPGVTSRTGPRKKAPMNILSITAGAADMFCGSCLRDNALAAELLARGHGVTLLPAYTPTPTDEPNVGAGQRATGADNPVSIDQRFALFRYTPALLDPL